MVPMPQMDDIETLLCLILATQQLMVERGRMKGDGHGAPVE